MRKFRIDGESLSFSFMILQAIFMIVAYKLFIPGFTNPDWLHAGLFLFLSYAVIVMILPFVGLSLIYSSSNSLMGFISSSLIQMTVGVALFVVATFLNLSLKNTTIFCVSAIALDLILRFVAQHIHMHIMIRRALSDKALSPLKRMHTLRFLFDQFLTLDRHNASDALFYLDALLDMYYAGIQLSDSLANDLTEINKQLAVLYKHRPALVTSASERPLQEALSQICGNLRETYQRESSLYTESYARALNTILSLNR